MIGPGLVSCLKALQPGNTLVIWKLDRLGRDLKHLITTVDNLRQQKTGLKVLTGTGAQIGYVGPNPQNYRLRRIWKFYTWKRLIIKYMK